MKRRRQENLVPIVSLVVVALLAVVVLPSALRPPPDSANASAALSPDAPPEENPDAIISSLQQAASSTAGATKSRRGPTSTTTPPPPPPPPAKLPQGHDCFGNPPLQTESLYAAECKPAFVGDNGGSTYQNVEPNRVRIGFWHTTGMPSTRGPIPDGEPSSSDGAMRTWQVMQTYFNQRYETYNRKIQFVAIEDAAAGSGPAGERATATQAVDDWKVLTSTHLNWPFCDELIRRELVCYNANPYPASFYERSQPFFFGYMMDFGKNIRLGAEYVCKRLVGPDPAKPYTADYAGGEWLGVPRKVGIITDTSNGNGISSGDVEASTKEQCGYSFASKFDVKDPGEDSSRSGDFAAAITDMIAKHVTTIYFTVNLTEILLLMQAAENANYFPEWVNIGNYGIDFNVIGAVLPKSQSSHLFGTSGWEMARSNAQTECYRAYKSIDPNNDPDGFFCGVHFFEVQQIINAIQEAGPNLTPRSMVQGWYDYGYRIRPEVWASQGGYSPGDYSFIDKHGEIWFDQTQQDPTTGILGTFIWTHNGKRYGVGELPAGKNPDLFKRGLRTTTET